MHIGLIGYGKMGKEVEKLILERGHTVAWILTKENQHELSDNLLKQADVAIEFTHADAVVKNIRRCFSLDIPVVTGTTGWFSDLEKIKTECLKEKKTLLTGSNFSVGVHLFSAINRYAARLMNGYADYDVAIYETHHTEKKDAPSGTAIQLAKDILPLLDRKENWTSFEPKYSSDLTIRSFRVENVPGTHIVSYSSLIDDIEIKHVAHNRKGFALGAVMAAEWLKDKTGYFTIESVFSFS